VRVFFVGGVLGGGFFGEKVGASLFGDVGAGGDDAFARGGGGGGGGEGVAFEEGALREEGVCGVGWDGFALGTGWVGGGEEAFGEGGGGVGV